MAKKKITKAIVIKRPEGRPTKYEPAILTQTAKYIESCKDGYERVVESKGKRSVMYSHRLKIKLPTMGGLAAFLHVDKTTIDEWRKKYPEFSRLIADMLGNQEDRLINGGISGDYNPTIAKVLLTKHGYREGVEHANPDGSNMFRPSDGERQAADKALREMSG